jgi:O-antigen/teichoic acid export membrane protein
MIPGIFIGNVFPILTQYYHAQDERLNDSIQKSFDFLIILAVPIAVGLMVLASPIINLIAGGAYLTASTISVFAHPIAAPQVLIILAFSTGVSFITIIFSTILVVIKKQNAQILPLIIITIINILLNLIFIPHYTYFASAIITFATESILLAWWFILSERYLHFKLRYNIILKALITGLLMGLILYFLSFINVLILMLIGAIIYGLIGYLLKLFDKETLRRILPGMLRGGRGE